MTASLANPLTGVPAPDGYLAQHPEPRRLDMARTILAEANEYQSDIVIEAADFVLLSRDPRVKAEDVWTAEQALVDLKVAGFCGEAMEDAA